MKDLVAAAEQVRRHAHAPFSGFQVGAAVRTTDGAVFTGCNVEISSYSHTCCAERVAVFKAVSEGHKEIVACAVVTDASPPAMPCGACRQVLHDFGPAMDLVSANLQGEQVALKLSELLPRAFTADEVLKHIRRKHS